MAGGVEAALQLGDVAVCRECAELLEHMGQLQVRQYHSIIFKLPHPCLSGAHDPIHDAKLCCLHQPLVGSTQQRKHLPAA